MNLELIKNNTHNNNIALFKNRSNQCTFYKKVSLTKNSNLFIENEKAGYSWYFNKIGLKDKTKLIKNPYYEIDIPNFKGKNFPHDYCFPNNKIFIQGVINLYKIIWNSNNKIVIHGDLALSNIFFYKQKIIYIIDWEHFHLADNIYYGFDIIHLLFINIYNRINQLSSKEIIFLQNCYGLLFNDVSQKNNILSNPFTNAKKYINQYSHRFGSNIPIKQKFVLADFPIEKLVILDKMITSQFS